MPCSIQFHAARLVAAEGVENKEQYSAMKELGIDYILGLFYENQLHWIKLYGCMECMK